MSAELRLDLLARDADLLDALAEGRPVDDPTVGLLAALRAEADSPAAVPAPRVRRHRRRAVAVAVMTLMVSSVGISAAAATSHPGDLLYGVRRAVSGPTSDDPSDVRALITQAEQAVARVSAGDEAARDRARDLVQRAQARIPALRVRDAEPLRRRAAAVRSALAAPAAPATATHPATLKHTVHAKGVHHHRHHKHPAHTVRPAVHRLTDVHRAIPR